jgi:uncharacterized protein
MPTPLPWIELFEAMRRALGPLGIALGVEQYEWLRQAMAKGYGGASFDGERIESWENLRRVARLLWVKPMPSYAEALAVFDQTFDAYRAAYQDCLPGPSEPDGEASVEATATPTETPAEINWPTIPPRHGYEPKAVETGKVKTLGAFQSSGSAAQDEGKYRLSPQALPLTLETVQRHWRLLRESVRAGGSDELDLEATVAQITDRGFLDDVVWRPGRRRRAELVVLVDDGAGMLPLRWAVEPLVQAVAGRWVPGQLYRFTSYPDRFLYGWERSSQATATLAVLSRLSRERTVLVVVSDGGAALGIVRGERIVGSLEFAARALPCVRQLIWLNPLPRERWMGNSAQAIAAGLGGRMLPLDEFGAAALRELGGVLV